MASLTVFELNHGPMKSLTGQERSAEHVRAAIAAPQTDPQVLVVGPGNRVNGGGKTHLASGRIAADIRWFGRAASMHGYARRNSVAGLASDTACRAAGQIGESGQPRSTDVRKGWVIGVWIGGMEGMTARFRHTAAHEL